MLECRLVEIDKPGILYRVGKHDSMQGLWYDAQGRPTGDIKGLSNEGLEMGVHGVFQHGLISCTTSLETLSNWFNEDDMKILILLIKFFL